MALYKSTLIALGFALASPIALAAPLTFTVEGVEARGGTLYIGVQTEAMFLQDDGVAGEKIKTPVAGSHTVTFDLPEGDYSVSVWHDLDDDEVFDRAESGWPEDGWAMINGSSLRGIPTFEAVKIAVPAGGASATETIIYPK